MIASSWDSLLRSNTDILQENRTNQVTLHDDRHIPLAMLLACIKHGSLDANTLSVFFSQDPSKHGLYVHMLHLVQKYDCPELHAPVIEEIAGCFKEFMEEECFTEEVFLMSHYEAIAQECEGGRYPKRLWDCFATGWEMLEYRLVQTKSIVVVLEENPDLARFLARRFCSMVACARRVEDHARALMEVALDGRFEGVPTGEAAESEPEGEDWDP